MMRREKRKLMTVAFILTMLASALSVLAQDAPPKPPPPPRGDGDVMVFERRIGPPPPGGEPQIEFMRERGPGADNTFVFVSTDMSFGSKIVKNAPYSAQATTETIQTLGDGNRITRKNTANVYRDSEGRTRHDQSLSSIGPWAAEGEPRRTSFINDPVNRVHYVLEPRDRTARKMALPPMPPPPPQRVCSADATKVRQEVKVRVMTAQGAPQDKISVIANEDIESDVANDVTQAVSVDGMRARHDKKLTDNARRESLGKQAMEGVEAEGTRTTLTIPAGEIGNEQPIQVVSERWYSPELQTVVMSRHSDPRFGETIFRLTNINRSEPSRSLFEVPADYTIKEGGPHQRIFRKKPGDEK
jgi:hypothetical protein